MAIVYEHRRAGKVYQVRTAGRSVRLYTNGVFHSQYSPSPRAATSMWDLLSMPALLTGGARPSSVLVLGVGGGAVLRKLSDLFDDPLIVGIELDSVHLDIGRRFFGLDRPNIELVAAEAGDWLDHAAARRFDLVVDDLFTDRGREPHRAVVFDSDWLARIARRLTPDGAVAANFAGLGEFAASAAGRLVRGDGPWRCGYSLRLPTLLNVVAGFGRFPVPMVDFVAGIGDAFGRRAAADVSIRRFPRRRGGGRGRR